MRFAVAFVLLTLTGCDSGDPGGGGDAGSFSVEVRGESAFSGPLDHTLTGPALFAVMLVTTDSTSERRFTIQLQGTRDGLFEMVTLVSSGEPIPEPGTYPAAAPLGGSATGFSAALTRSQDSPSFFEEFDAMDGTVTITAASADRIDGEVAFTGTSGPDTVTVSGSFTARPGR